MITRRSELDLKHWFAGMYLNIGTGAAVSQQLSALRLAVESEYSLSKSIARIDEVLAEKAKIRKNILNSSSAGNSG